MNLFFWVSLPLAFAVDCTFVGTDAAPAGGCTCKQTSCTEGQFCAANVADDVGECLTSAIGVCTGHASNEMAAACKCGDAATIVLAGQKCTSADASVTTAILASADCDPNTGSAQVTKHCKCGADNCGKDQYCHSTAGTGTCNANKVCAVTNGSDDHNVTGSTTLCQCGTNTVAADKFCAANLSWNSKPFVKCKTQNKLKTNTETTRCTCGNGKVCETTEYCFIDAASSNAESCTSIGDASTQLNACAYENGKAEASQCACGTDAVVAATKGCSVGVDGAGAEVATAVAACGANSAFEKVGADCACGTKATCTTAGGHYCTAAGEGSCSAVAPDACTNTNGQTSDGTICTCTGTSADTTHVCSAAEACTITATSATVNTGTCAAPAGTACTDAVKAGAAGCNCGKTKTCAENEFCFTEACVPEADACSGEDGMTLNATNKACVCGAGKASCAHDEACLKMGTAAPFTYACLPKNESDALKAIYAAKACDATACKTLVDAEAAKCVHDATTCKSVCDADADEDSNSAACIGQFVATMGAAMNSL